MDKIIQCECNGVRLKLTLSTQDLQSHSRLSDFIRDNTNAYIGFISDLSNLLDNITVVVAQNTHAKT